MQGQFGRAEFGAVGEFSERVRADKVRLEFIDCGLSEHRIFVEHPPFRAVGVVFVLLRLFAARFGNVGGRLLTRGKFPVRAEIRAFW